MAKILITGATGFIGTHLVDYLVRQAEHKLAVIVRDSSASKLSVKVRNSCEVFFLKKDDTNLDEIILQAKPDCVVHLATCFLVNHTKEQIDDLIDSNVKFPTKILEAMTAHGVKRFINTATYAEYFNHSKVYDPLNLYAATKRAFEDILRFHINAKGLNNITLRLYDTYGPRDPRRKLITILREAYRNKQTLDMSPGDQQIDLVYVDDVVAAFNQAINYLLKSSSAVDLDLQVASGESHTIKEVVKILEEVLKTKLNINWGKRPYRERENMIVKSDISKTKKILGWQPQYLLKKGFQQLVQEES